MGKRKLKDEVAGLRAEIADLRVLVYDLKDDLAALRGRVEALETSGFRYAPYPWWEWREPPISTPPVWTSDRTGSAAVRYEPVSVWREQWRHIGNSINDATRPDDDA